jgi:nucleoside-diphosphate-sugar epimerase
MKVFLAGASGALGVPLTRELLARGHEVLGLTQTREGASRLDQMGAIPVVADALDRHDLLGAIEGLRADAVIHEVTALTKTPLRVAGMRVPNRLRTDGSTNLLAAAERVGAKRFVTQSIILGYGFHDHGARLLTEDDPFGQPEGTATDAVTHAILAAERLAFSVPEGIALRYGLLYGGDIDRMGPMLAKRSLPIASGGRLGWVHHRDAALATVAALENGAPGAAYNIVDDLPATWEELYTAMADQLGAPRPRKVPRWVMRLIAPYVTTFGFDTSMRVSNAKAKADLGWAPVYPTYRDGIRAMA